MLALVFIVSTENKQLLDMILSVLLQCVFWGCLVAGVAILYNYSLEWYKIWKTWPEKMTQKFEKERHAVLPPLKVPANTTETSTSTPKQNSCKTPIMIDLYVTLQLEINVLVAHKCLPIHVSKMDTKSKPLSMFYPMRLCKERNYQ